MPLDCYHLMYTDEFNEINKAQFSNNEYHNLMELLFDKYVQDWGDYKGRAWCGTCHIQIHNACNQEQMTITEKHTLSKILSSNKNSRLACQIPLNKNLHGVSFSILKDDAV